MVTPTRQGVSFQPRLTPVSTDIDVLSCPFASHPDAQGALWHQAEMHKGLMYQQHEAIRIRITQLEQMTYDVTYFPK